MVAGATVVSGGVKYVVWRRVTDTHVIALPIVREGDGRNEVRLTGWGTLVQMGLPGGCWAVRIAGARPIRPAVKIGETPADVWQEICLAVRREQAALGAEADRHSVNRAHSSVNLWRS